MKIIRWLLSHSLFILLIVAVIYAYMFWGNLLGKDTPAGKAVAYLSDEFVEVKEFVNAVKAKQAQISVNKSSDQKSSDQQSSAAISADVTEDADAGQAAQTTASIAAEAVAVENTAEMTSKPVEQPVLEQPQVAVSMAASVAEIEQQPVVDKQNDMAVEQNTASIDSNDGAEQIPEQINAGAVSANSQQSATVKNPWAVAAGVDKPAATAVASSYSNTEDKFVPAEVEKHLSNVDGHGEVIDVSQPGGTVRENWIAARKAFYQRNYELSEQSYQKVISDTKNNFDAYGELGNVYFNQGKDKQAASAYYEAAAILISNGQVSRARSLMGLLRHLDRTKANELQHLIDAAKS